MKFKEKYIIYIIYICNVVFLTYFAIINIIEDKFIAGGISLLLIVITLSILNNINKLFVNYEKDKKRLTNG